jgi:Arc/MetJ-type ribon-helix-helix transcriptional regulator
MTGELQSETERLVQEEIQSGHFESIDELIIQGVHALRTQNRTKAPVKRTAVEVIAHIRQLREGVTLGGLRTKDLMNEGRP